MRIGQSKNGAEDKLVEQMCCNYILKCPVKLLNLHLKLILLQWK